VRLEVAQRGTALPRRYVHRTSPALNPVGALGVALEKVERRANDVGVQMTFTE